MSDRGLAVCFWKKLSLRVRLWLLASLSGCVVPILFVLPARAQAVDENTEPIVPSAPAISQLSEIEQPATTIERWVAQIEASLVQITEVRVETTEAGLKVILEYYSCRYLEK